MCKHLCNDQLYARLSGDTTFTLLAITLHGGSCGMAQIRLAPPDPFDFRNPDDWPRWRRRFQQFREASGLSEESASKQISTFLYCLGEEAENVLASTNATAEDRSDFGRTITKFDDYFKVRKNVIYERARFNRRNQQRGETAEQYIMALYSLSEHSDYGDLTEQMIRDRLVVGIRDTTLSEKLQMDSALTLESAKKAIRQREAVHEQQQTLKGDGRANAEIEAVHSPRKYKQRTGAGQRTERREKWTSARPQSNSRAGEKCGRCGRERHPREKCPAKDEQCHNCKRRGHFSSQCRSKAVSSIHDGDPSDSAFLDTVSSSRRNTWSTRVTINGTQVPFKLDTGAEVTAISKGTWQILGKPALQPPDKQLFGPAQHRLAVLGQFHCHLTHKGNDSYQHVFVINRLQSNLLGLPAIIALQLAVRMDSIHNTTATPVSWKSKFPKVFQGLGTLSGDYHIQLRPDAKPHALFTPRRVPLPLRGKVAKELDRMEKAGVISRVSEPTPWCAGMVVVPKKSGSVRICVDLKLLNQSVLREVHPLPKVDETLAQLAGATVFSKLDANSGFWQIPLAESSRLLTTFITPIGRFCFNKLPFGISSAPEHFQRRMSELLSGLEGVQCQIDDIVVFGKDSAEHDRCLEAVLSRIEQAGATLNPEKCEFNRKSLTFLGHVIDADGIRADPAKTEAIRKMSPPASVPGLRRFLGMANQLGKFTPNLAEITQPLRELLSKSRAWTWGPAQSAAYKQVQDELTKPTVLALYDPAAPSKVSADASSYGLGAVLLQLVDGSWRPVSYASRSMTETERRYAQIEKEALATTWACEKFSDYLLGKHFQVETDHKPLVPLLGTKHLDTLPPRILRFRLRLDRFDYDIRHVAGKELYTADTLSRAPMPDNSSSDSANLQELAELCMTTAISHLPASRDRLEAYRKVQSEDPQCQLAFQYCSEGWPNEQDVDPALRAFVDVRGELTVGEGLLMRGHRIVVPKVLQPETLKKLHDGHQGLTRCRLRAKMAVWWPGLSKQLTDFVRKCPECTKESKAGKEPLIPTPLPEYPWQQVATDLFSLNGSDYLVAVDYFSRYPEVIQLRSTVSQAIINALKTIFARHGIPETLRSDNGPQFASKEFADFAKNYQFRHITSSPHYPTSNGQAERAVQTVKHLLKKTDDPFIALLSYRATPLPWCGRSPAELLMGRNIRSTLPQTTESLVPQWPYLSDFRQINEDFKKRQKTDYDRRHRTRELPEIPDDTEVWITTDGRQTAGRTVMTSDTPRSYIIETPSGEIRRNRSHLNTRSNGIGLCRKFNFSSSEL